MTSHAVRWVLAGSLLLGTSMLAQTEQPGGGQAPAELDALAKEFRSARRDFSEKADFTPAAVDRRRTELKTLRGRLDAMPHAKWAVSDQVDWYLLLAEMNQADFEMRVLRPWARDPGFYVSPIVARLGDIEKLTAEAGGARSPSGSRAAPARLKQARTTSDRADALARGGDAPRHRNAAGCGEGSHARYQGPVTALRVLEKNATSYPALASCGQGRGRRDCRVWKMGCARICPR